MSELNSPVALFVVGGVMLSLTAHEVLCSYNGESSFLFTLNAPPYVLSNPAVPPYVPTPPESPESTVFRRLPFLFVWL